MFNFDSPDFKHDSKSDTLDSNQLITSNQSNASGTSSSSKPLSSFFNKLTHSNSKQQNARSKSPFKFMQNRLSREPSPMNQSTASATAAATKPPTGRTQNKPSSAPSGAKVSRSSEFGMKSPQTTVGGGGQQSQIQQIGSSNASASQVKPLGRKSIQPQPQYDEFACGEPQQQDYTLMESDDVELQAIIDYVDEYYYGVRIFPGQDASKVKHTFLTACL